MADAGLAPRDLQAIMRHSRLATTEAYYLRDRVQDQAKRIAACLGTLPAAETQQKAAVTEATAALSETYVKGG